MNGNETDKSIKSAQEKRESNFACLVTVMNKKEKQ